MAGTHRVVVIGGGFGGLNSARGLRRTPAQVTLIDRKNYHLFQPLLYQVATGSLSPGDITAALRPVFRKDKTITVLMGDVVDIDVSGKRVMLSDGELPYDTLIVAAGSEPSYFGHNAWSRAAPSLKTIEDATEIRRRWLVAFEAAEREASERDEAGPDVRRAWLTFVIVGGGPTGVELAGALGEISRDTLKGDFRYIRPEEARIFLIEADTRILPSFPERLSNAAEEALARLGVRTLVNTRVTALDESGVTIAGAAGTRRIEARTVIWAAGVKPSPLAQALARAGASLERGRVVVQPDLSLPGHPEVFVIGDMAFFTHGYGEPLPGLAPVAMQQGSYVAQVIRARLKNRRVPKPFRYFDKGNLATIGRGEAVGEIRRLKLAGMPAWLVWVFVHLMYLVGFQNRLLVFIQWAFYYVTFNRRARIITGVSPFPLRTVSRQDQPDRAA